MGKFNSAFTFTGSVGGVHGYTRQSAPGVTFVGKNGGPSKEDFQNNPRMDLTRQNAMEFSGASLGAKNFYRNLPFELRRPLAGTYRRVLKFLVPLIHSDPFGQRGKRGLFFASITNNFSSIIVGKNLSPKLFSNLISSPFIVTPAVNRQSVSIQFLTGVIPSEITFVANATHIMVKGMIFGLANIEYDPSINRYKSVDVDLKAGFDDSGFIDITTGSGGAFNITPNLPAIPLLNQCSICVLWVEYFQYVSGNYNYIDNSADVVLFAQ